MKAGFRCFALLVFLTSHSALAQEPIVVDFEQLPSSTQCFAWYPIYDRGAAISGGAVVDSYFSGVNETRVYNTAQPIFNPCGRSNPLEIHFDEPMSQVSFDLMTPNDFFTIADDTGWSQVISVRAGGTQSYHGMTVEIPSTAVSHITITDQCNYYATTGCNSPWRFAIDNVSFRPVRPCLAISGESSLAPNDSNNSDPYREVGAVVVVVTDCQGTPMEGVEVNTLIEPVDLSGGHTHPVVVPLAQRPAGGLREDGASGGGVESITLFSDSNGEIQLQLVSPEESGTYSISPECVDTACYPPVPPLDVDVIIEDLISIPPVNAFYTLTEYLPGTTVGKNIGDNGMHNGQNHHLTPDATDKLWRLAFYYAAKLDFAPQPEKLHINDASLPWGGRFDVSGNWKRPHNRHRKGTVVDVRANQRPGAIPPDPYTRRQFENAANDVGASAVFEPGRASPDNDHYHVRLRRVEE